MPINAKAAKVPLPEADVLADIYGVGYDLDSAIELSLRAISLAKESPHDYYLIEAITTAAIVRYFRCLSTGQRLGLQAGDIAQLSQADQKTHNYFKNLRDKFVAHSVNPYELSYVTATVRTRDGIPEPVTSLQPGHHRVVLSQYTASELLDLLRKVRDINDAKATQEKGRLLARINELPLSEVHGWDLHQPTSMSRAHAGKSRPTKRRCK